MKNILLVSGFDSLILYHKLKQDGIEVKPVYFRFGAPNEKAEIQTLPGDTEILNLPDFLKFKAEQFEAGEVPDLAYRNYLAFLMVTHIYNPDRIYDGNLICDHFPDSQFHFKSIVQGSISYVRGKPIKLVSPWADLGYTKMDVAKYAKDAGIDFSSYVSCLNAAPCGECLKCRQRELIDLMLSDRDEDLARVLVCQQSSQCDFEAVYKHFGTRDHGEIFRIAGI